MGYQPIRIFTGFLSTCILGTWLAATVAQACICDCNGDGEVTVNELVAAVNIALGAFDVAHCASADRDGDGEVTVDEVLVGVLGLLNGCPTPPVTTTGTPSSPTATATATVTNASTPATATPPPTAAPSRPTATGTATASSTAAVAATFTPTMTSTLTPSRTLTATRATVTFTAKITPTLTATATVTPAVAGTPGAVARTCRLLAGSSKLTFQSKNAAAVVNLTGSQVWRFAVAKPDGTREISSLPSDSHFDCVSANVLGAFQVAGCIRMDPATPARGVIDCTGGQVTSGYNEVASVDHNTNQNNVGFAQDPQCDDVYWNPNGDPSGELVTSWVEDGEGSHVHLGVCNSGVHLDQSGAFPPGGLHMTQDLILRVFLRSTCTAGLCPLDGAPFDSAAGDIRVAAALSSGMAKGVIFNLNNNAAVTLGTTGSGNGPNICGFTGTDPCVTSGTGTAYAELCSDPPAGSLHSGRLVSAFTAFDLPSPIYDAVATIGITCQ